MRALTLCLALGLLAAGCGGSDPSPEDTAPDTTAQDSVRFEIFLVELEPDGVADADRFGCGDVLRPLARTVPPGADPLLAALGTLFQTPDTLGLVNTVEGLELDGLLIERGVAEVRLTGDLSLGGVCDAPRVEAQLRRTIRAAAGVDSVRLLLGGQPLGEALSLEG